MRTMDADRDCLFDVSGAAWPGDAGHRLLLRLAGQKHLLFASQQFRETPESARALIYLVSQV